MYVKNRTQQRPITAMHFKPQHTHLPLWELRAWYRELWPMQRWMFNIFVIVPAVLAVVTITFRMPNMPDNRQKVDVIEFVRSDAFEDYTPTQMDLANMTRDTDPIVTPLRYRQYVDNNKQTSKHRKLKHKYKHKKDTKHVKQSGTTN